MYKHNRREAGNFNVMDILVEKLMVLNRLLNNGIMEVFIPVYCSLRQNKIIK